MRALIAAAGLAAAVSVPLLSGPAIADSALTDAQKDEVREIVREYILENPEILEEAIIELRARRTLAREAEQREKAAALAPQLYNDPRDFAVGPENASVTVVEFFDYNCPYCRVSAPWVKEAIETYGDQVRFIFKEAPIFSDTRETSDLAARAALAAMGRGKYLEVHFGLMEGSGTLSTEQVRAVVEDAGLNWNRLQRAMESPETTGQLEAGLDLLAELGDSGTPTFVINGEIVLGADTERLDQMIRDALGAGE